MSGVVSPAVDLGQAAELVAELCRRFEGFRPRAYLCPAGVATIGYGASTYLDGRPVRLGDPALSREAAERLLLRQIERVYLPGARALCPGLSAAALAAVTDFAFNLGLARLKGSTLRRRLLVGDVTGAAIELRKWTRAGGRVLPGLVLRREAEAALLSATPADSQEARAPLPLSGPESAGQQFEVRHKWEPLAHFWARSKSQIQGC